METTIPAVEALRQNYLFLFNNLQSMIDLAQNQEQKNQLLADKNQALLQYKAAQRKAFDDNNAELCQLIEEANIVRAEIEEALIELKQIAEVINGLAKMIGVGVKILGFAK